MLTTRRGIRGARLAGGSGRACCSAAWCGQRSFLEREVGVQVHLRRFDLLVSEPQRDHRGADAGVQEPHRGGVAQDVRGDRLSGQRRAALGGVGSVLCDPAGERLAGERRARAGREQRIGGRTGTFGEPRAEHRGGLPGQRGDPLLAALACRRDVRAGTEVSVAAVKTGQL